MARDKTASENGNQKFGRGKQLYGISIFKLPIALYVFFSLSQRKYLGSRTRLRKAQREWEVVQEVPLHSFKNPKVTTAVAFQLQHMA